MPRITVFNLLENFTILMSTTYLTTLMLITLLMSETTVSNCSTTFLYIFLSHYTEKQKTHTYKKTSKRMNKKHHQKNIKQTKTGNHK